MKKTVGQRLAEIRNDLQFSQEQMAKFCSMTPVTISRIENMSHGDGDKHNRSLLLIARATGINDNYLLYGTGEVWDTGTPQQNIKRIRDLVYVKSSATSQPSAEGWEKAYYEANKRAEESEKDKIRLWQLIEMLSGGKIKADASFSKD